MRSYGKSGKAVLLFVLSSTHHLEPGLTRRLSRFPPHPLSKPWYTCGMGKDSYIDVIARKIGLLVGMDLDDYDDRPLLRIYALLGLVKPHKVSSNDVHDAWAVWRLACQPLHRSIVPFESLTPEVQAKDDEYRDAINKVMQEGA